MFSLKQITIVFVSLLCFGCSIVLPFNNRLSYSKVQEAKKISIDSIGPLSIKWEPFSFPELVDIQGASGFVGSASRTRIPTGVGLANRIIEFLDTAIGIDDESLKTLTISVINAKSKFKYSAALTVVLPTIDEAECIFQAQFKCENINWQETFQSSSKDPTIGGTTQTGELEKVWDDIAEQVGRSIINHLKSATLQ